MRLVNATVLGNLVSAHYEHDEKKFAAYVQFIIDAYEERGEKRQAEIIRKRMDGSKEIMRKIKNKEGLTDAEFTTVERCLLLGDVDDKILNYQLGVKIGVIDDPFRQDKMEFKKTDKIMNQIRNKEELPKPDRMTLERYLRLYDVSESILNYQCRADEENPFEISEQI